MLFATLGKLDLITVLILLGAAILPSKLLLFAGIYLVLKAAFFIWMSRDVASYGDLVAGIYLLILSLGVHVPYFHSVVLFYLIQKTILTFVAIIIKLFFIYDSYREDLPSFFRFL